MNTEHNENDHVEIDKTGPSPQANDQELAADDGQEVGPADSAENGTTQTNGSEKTAPDGADYSETKAAHEPDIKSASASQSPRSRWRKWGAKLWAGGATVVLTGALSAWLAGWFTFLAGPPGAVAPSATSISHPGHLPGRQDVSTMAPGRRFYAVPNFYDFQSCGPPCWLPLYQRATEKSPFVTDGWPCEYYEPGSVSSGPFCLKPPFGRRPSEMADPAFSDSGDRVLVICQVTNIGKSQPAETIRNDIDQSSDIWDMIALPAAHISSDSIVADRLSRVAGMPGLYEAFAPDIWLGNTGWHNIPCK
jgi:hypothetical protein